MKRTLWLLLPIFMLASCSSKPSGPQTLTVMTHDSFAATDTVIKAFEDANNAKVTFIKSGDAGAALNKAILTKQSPLADVFYGVDNTFLSRALSADIYQPYDSPALKAISPAFLLDPTQRALPVDYGDVCINYDKAYFATLGLPAPASLEDLARPEYKGLLVTENPATSSPGLAFPARHRKALRRSRLYWILEEPAAKWSRRCGWMGDGLLHQFQRLVGQRPAAPAWFPMAPALPPK